MPGDVVGAARLRRPEAVPVTGVFQPPIDARTGQVSAKSCGMAILRPVPGGYIAFRTAGEAIGHPTGQPVRPVA